jgi:hypothetical protein
MDTCPLEQSLATPPLAGALAPGAPPCANPQKALTPIATNTNARIVFIAFLSPCLSRLNYKTFDQLTFVT